APGSPRLVTVRLAVFVVLLLAVVAAAYAALRWYAMGEWYVGVDRGHLAVYQGRPGGFLWFKARLADETAVTTHEVMAYRLPQLRAHHQEPTLAAAKDYVGNLHAEYLATRGRSAGSTSPAQRKGSGRSSAGKPGTTPTSGTTTTGTTTTGTTTTGATTPTGAPPPSSAGP
ncbi:MAG: hypothetical protein ACRDV8_02445, partial [Acidimicrobiales bacterium]